MRAAVAAIVIATSAWPVQAEVPFLRLPIDCDLGRTCYIEDLMDRDPGPGVADYACGLKARADHGGVDFALLSFEQIDTGIAVLAAADGVVAAIRDGVPDVPATDPNSDDIVGKECGNAVRLRHDNGYQTLYCHMRIGSVSVAEGQRVSAGDTLGFVGLSGLTNYPHLHLTVLKDGARVDPFRADTDLTCDTETASAPGLWLDPPEYERAGLFTAGFSDAVPTLDTVRSGAARRQALSTRSALVLYGRSFYAANGDVLRFSAMGPEGDVFEHTHLVKDAKADMFRAFGRRAPEGGWTPGTYRGRIMLERAGRVLAVRHASVTID